MDTHIITEDLELICAPGDRRSLVEALLQSKGVSYERQEYAGDGVNFLISFGSPWQWDKVYGAHYDRVSRAPGANDNGASISCLVNLAAHLQKENYSGSFAIVLFDKEEPCNRENGGPGSRWFAEQLRNARHQPELIVVLDVIGRGDVLFTETFSDQVMADSLRKVIPGLEEKSTPGSDDVIMGCEGVSSVLLCALPRKEIDRNSPPTWAMLHSEIDDVDTIDPNTIDWVYRALLEILRDHPQIVEGIPAYPTDQNTLPLWEEVY